MMDSAPDIAGPFTESNYHNTSSPRGQLPRGTKTGYVTDQFLLRHKSKKAAHENPKRLIQLNARIKSSGLMSFCVNVPVRRCTDEEVLTTHTRKHLEVIKSLETREYLPGQNFCYLDDYEDTYGCHDSTRAVLSAAGGATDLGCLIANGKLRNGFAAIRPPGHHCGREGPQGFCLVNNVAIAANNIRKRCPHIKRILLVDWDVHHGNGTEEIFLNDPDVLFFSMHRREIGFFPESGDSILVGGSIDKSHQEDVKDLLQSKTRLGVPSEDPEHARKLDELIQNTQSTLSTTATTVIGPEGVPVLTPSLPNGQAINLENSDNFHMPGSLFQPWPGIPLLAPVLPPQAFYPNNNNSNPSPSKPKASVGASSSSHAPLSCKEPAADNAIDASAYSKPPSSAIKGLSSSIKPVDDDDTMADSDAVTGAGLSESDAGFARNSMMLNQGETAGMHKPGRRVDGPTSEFLSASYSSSGDSDVVGGEKISRPDILDPAERIKAEQANLAARGRTINVPLPTRLGDFDYLNVIKATLLPVALEFKPDLIIVSAGFDPSPSDPLGNECVTAAGFYALTRLLMSINSKIMVCLEGGYFPNDVAQCGEACLRALLDLPYNTEMSDEDRQRIDSLHDQAVAPLAELAENQPAFSQWLQQEETVDALCTPVDDNVAFPTLLPKHYLQPEFDQSGKLIRDLTTVEIYNQLAPTEALRRSRRQLDEYSNNQSVRDDMTRIQNDVVAFQKQQRNFYIQQKNAHQALKNELQPIWHQICASAQSPIPTGVGTTSAQFDALQRNLPSSRPDGTDQSANYPVLTLPVTPAGMIVIPPQLVLTQDQLDTIKPRISAFLKAYQQHQEIRDRIQITQQQLDYTNQFETDISTRLSSVLVMLEAVVDTLICQSDYWQCFNSAGISAILSFLGSAYQNCLIDPSVWYYKPPQVPHDDNLGSMYTARRDNRESRQTESRRATEDRRVKTDERRRRRQQERSQNDQTTHRLEQLGLPIDSQFQCKDGVVYHYSSVNPNWTPLPSMTPHEAVELNSQIIKMQASRTIARRAGGQNISLNNAPSNTNNNLTAASQHTSHHPTITKESQELMHKQLELDKAISNLSRLHYTVPNDGFNVPVDNATLERLALLTSFDHSRGLHLESVILEQTMGLPVSKIINPETRSYAFSTQEEDRLPGMTDIAWGIHVGQGNNSLNSIVRHPFTHELHVQPSVLIDSVDHIYTLRLSKMQDILADPFSLYLTPLAQQRVPLLSTAYGHDVKLLSDAQKTQQTHRLETTSDLIARHVLSHHLTEPAPNQVTQQFSHPDPVADVSGLLLSQAIEHEALDQAQATRAKLLSFSARFSQTSAHSALASTTPALLMVQTPVQYHTSAMFIDKQFPHFFPLGELLAQIQSQTQYLNPFLPINQLCLSLCLDCHTLYESFEMYYQDALSRQQQAIHLDQQEAFLTQQLQQLMTDVASLNDILTANPDNEQLTQQKDELIQGLALLQQNIYQTLREREISADLCQKSCIMCSLLFRFFEAKRDRIAQIQSHIASTQFFSTLLRHELIQTTRYGLLQNLIDFEKQQLAHEQAMMLQPAFDSQKPVRDMLTGQHTALLDPLLHDSAATELSCLTMQHVTPLLGDISALESLKLRAQHDEDAFTASQQQIFTDLSTLPTLSQFVSNQLLSQPLSITKGYAPDNVWELSDSSEQSDIPMEHDTPLPTIIDSVLDSSAITQGKALRARISKRVVQYEAATAQQHNADSVPATQPPQPPRSVTPAQRYLDSLIAEMDQHSQSTLQSATMIAADTSESKPVRGTLPEFVMDDHQIDDFLFSDVMLTFFCPQMTDNGCTAASNDTILKTSSVAQRKTIYKNIISPQYRIFTQQARSLGAFGSLHHWFKTFNHFTSQLQQQTVSGKMLTPDVVLDALLPQSQQDELLNASDEAYIVATTYPASLPHSDDGDNIQLSSKRSKISARVAQAKNSVDKINALPDGIQLAPEINADGQHALPATVVTPNGRTFITAAPYATAPLPFSIDFHRLIVQPMQTNSLSFMLSQLLNSTFLPHSRLDELWMVLLSCLNDKERTKMLLAQASQDLYQRHPILELDINENKLTRNNNYCEQQQQQQQQQMPTAPNSEPLVQLSPLAEVSPLTNEHLETLYDRTMSYWLYMPLIGNNVISLDEFCQVIEQNRVPKKWLSLLQNIKTGDFHEKFIQEGLEYLKFTKSNAARRSHHHQSR